MELRVRHIARNVLFNWLGTVANMAVGFFLSPFILHRLGDIAYGVWVLAVSVVGYMSLLDLGMQSAVLRFVSKGHAKQDHNAASDAVSAALWVRLQISTLVLVLSAVLAYLFPLIFKIPPSLAHAARIATVLIGVNVAISMSMGVVGGVLSALNRYDLQNYVNFVQSAIRVIGVVTVLRTGHGIVAIATCESVAALVGNFLLVWVARRLYPELRVQFKQPKKDTLRQIWSYSSYAFLTTIAIRLVYQTDNLVVGAFVSASAVTFFAIANSLCRYADQIVGAMSATFVPAASTYEAAGDTASLLKLYLNGTRATLAISLPVLITLILRGGSFISLWMGQQYARQSGTVLILLSVALIFQFANRAAIAIAYGVEKHKTSAMWSISEGLANLALSIVLVHWYGIYGVALGTMIPSLVTQVVLWPGYISRLVGLSYIQVISKVWAPVFFASIPFAAATWLVNRFFPAHHLTIFFLQIIVLLPVFMTALAIVFRGYVRQELFPKVRGFVFANS